MNLSTKIVIVVAVVAAVIVLAGGYLLLNSALSPLEQKETKATILVSPNVEVQATTFNGNVIIQASTGDQIEIIYDLQAPQGHINEIVASTTNQTQNGDGKIVAEAKFVDSSSQIRVNYRADITIMLPSNSRYNLTLSTLNGNIIKPQLNDSLVEAMTNNGKVEIKDDNAISIVASSLNGAVDIGLVQGTLFQVDANAANGHVTYQGIPMNTSVRTNTRLTGYTTGGYGNLILDLNTANGDITITYFTK